MKLPKLLYFYTLVLGIFGIVMGVWSAISPTGMLDIVGLTMEGSGAPLINGLFAARNAAFGVLFLVVLFFYRTKEAMLAIYISRFILDIMDTLVIRANGLLDIARILEQGLFFLIPIPFVIHYLHKMDTVIEE